MRIRQYYTYIITNRTKTVLYIGMTNNLEQRLADHYFNCGKQKTFAGRYKCHFLFYYEIKAKPMEAIWREKEIKGMSRERKEKLIEKENPGWKFLNEKIMDWPPDEGWRRGLPTPRL
ncbi:MAG TPA: GIY-YIG nuclease family protein [Bacteroidia bacterium]|jgi:putative endonuclease|nr:GIY-YIG nuclease family protein [Bacteroidia bacterium]